jgi:hypothetical protein
MSMLVRHDAANAVDQAGLAQSIVFDGLTDDPANDEAHQRLDEDMLNAAAYAEFELRSEQLGSLHRIVRGTRIDMPLARHMRMAVEYRNTHQHDDIAPDFGSVPRTEKIAGVVLKNRNRFGDTEVALRRRSEFAATTASSVTHAMNPAPRLDLQFGLEINADATESGELQVFGMRDQVRAALLYRLDKRDYVQIQPAWSRYRTQAGNYLGSGKQISWELGHLFRTGYPDWKARLTGIHTRFSNAADAVLGLPVEANIYGLCFGSGDASRFVYSRAWRPYADYCATHNDSSGRGYSAALGLGGSLVGHDRLSLDLSQESGGANVVNGLSRAFELNYRFYY